MNYNVTPQLPPNGISVAELFAGGGLMAKGLKAAGFNLIWANDFVKTAAEVYRMNIGEHMVLGDITDQEIQEQVPDADVIAGGPPCQDYSSAGNNKGEDGERGKLVWTYLRIIESRQPKAFIFENVKNLVKKHYKTFESLLLKFEQIGYRVSWKLINCWDYGVAQIRERVFVVGIRDDLGFPFEFPEPELATYRNQTLLDVIGDLPTPDKQDNGMYWYPKGKYTFSQANRVQSMDKPSNTIPAHHNSGQPIHPTESPRRFTIRECLRIQSAPDDYILPDGMKLGPQYRIVGNGVPTKMAYILGQSLAEQLKHYAGYMF